MPWNAQLCVLFLILAEWGWLSAWTREPSAKASLAGCGDPQGDGYNGCRKHKENWGCHGPVRGVHTWGISRRSYQDAHSWASWWHLWSFCGLWCCCAPMSWNPSAVLITSVLWVGWGRFEPPGQCLAHVEKLATHSLCCQSPLWEKLWTEGVSFGTCCLREGVTWIKWLFSLPSSIHRYFAPVICWSFSAELLNFHKSTCLWVAVNIDVLGGWR